MKEVKKCKMQNQNVTWQDLMHSRMRSLLLYIYIYIYIDDYFYITPNH